MISLSPCGPPLLTLAEGGRLDVGAGGAGVPGAGAAGAGAGFQYWLWSQSSLITDATALNPRMHTVVARMASIAIFTSLDSIFLPMYSGVRPTIRPAMKTATTAYSKMP